MPRRYSSSAMLRMRCLHLGGLLRTKFPVNRSPNVGHRCARRVHLARPGRDVDADLASDAVLVPLQHVAVFGARAAEAILVALMPHVLAAAKARDIAQDFGM